MALTYTIDTTQRVVIARGQGFVTDTDLTDYFAALRQDPVFQPHFNHLSDYRDMSALEVTGGSLRTLVATTPFYPTVQRAFVVTNINAFALARMYEMTAQLDMHLLRLFSTFADACGWLDIRVPELPT